MARGEATDPTWKYVVAALEQAGTFARSRGYKWKGESCGLVSALALNLVIDTRNEAGKWRLTGQKLLKTSNPSDINLAHADHYLHMRAAGAIGGPSKAGAELAKIHGYDKIKQQLRKYQGHPLADYIEKWLREDKTRPLSAPGPDAIYWAEEGLKDGIADFLRNPGINNDITQLFPKAEKPGRLRRT